MITLDSHLQFDAHTTQIKPVLFICVCKLKVEQFGTYVPHVYIFTREYLLYTMRYKHNNHKQP